MITLTNKYLTVAFKTLGGELTSIKDTDGIEYLWQGDATFWSGQAPVLFPICGGLRQDKTIYDNEMTATMPRHGLVRKREFHLIHQSDNQVTFSIKNDKEMLAHYPYPFELRISYTLSGKTIRTSYQVLNQGEETMPYFIGGHPGFNCPLFEGEAYEDYYLEFEQAEQTTSAQVFPDTGLISLENRRPFLSQENRLSLTHELFSEDSVVLDQLASRKISLKSTRHKKGLELSFSDFPYLILWSTQNKGPFIAIEPWLGLSTAIEESDQFTEKKNVHFLSPHETSTHSFDITIF